MTRTRSSVAAALLLLVTTASSALASVRPEGLAPLHGREVRPTVVQFSALPRITTPYTGPTLERREAINPEAEEELERLKEHPVGPRPQELAQFTMDASVLQPLAPTVGNGFEGITSSGYIPSEPTVAAGPLNIFSTGNSTVTVTNKDGSNRVETSGTSFFGVGGGEGGISDAQCYYDAVHQRFVALAFTSGSNFSNFYLIISQTTDARGLWYRYKFDMTKDGNNQTTNWSDYQALGLSEDKIAFSAQQFRFSDDTYAYQKIRVIDRALAFSGQAVPYVDFVAFNAPSGQNQDVFVTKVARNLTPGDDAIHCLCVRTNGGSNVTYRTITGPPSAPVLGTGAIVPVSSYSAPPDAEQKGSTTRVVTNDCRPTDFYVRNGVLICAWHSAVDIGGGAVCAVRLLRLRTSDLAVLTDETYGAAGIHYYFPAVTVDSAGTIFMGFDRSSTTEYPSAYATGKRRVDAALQPSALLKAGLAANLQSRWGDYTGIDNDASLSGPGGSTAWYAGQWTKSSFTFGTWINRLSFTYGQLSGTVTDDCDGATGTTGDRQPLAGVTLTLMQGASTVATTQSDAAGNYSFGYLETGVYDVVVTPPAGGSAVDAVPGAGGNSQVEIAANDLRVDLTNAQTSTGNGFLVTRVHAAPAITSLSPSSRLAGSGGFTLTVNGSGFVRCSNVLWDGSARTTTYVSATQLTAVIPGADVASPAIHAVTVQSPAPGGGTSAPEYFPVKTGTDATPPVVSLTSPTGGESWAVGSAHAITWTATDNVGVANVDLDYSTDGGATFPFTIARAIPNSGSYAWTVPGTPSAAARVRVRARDADLNLGSDSSHVNFTIAGWTVTATAGAHGTIAPAGAIGVPDGATPQFTITPDTGYQVANVLVNGVSVGAVTSYTFGPVHANQTIAASFVIRTYTLSVAVSGSGTVTKSPDQPQYDHGTIVTLTAVPAVGWSFRNWTGDTTTTTNPLVFPITTNRSLTANFYQHVYTWVATGSASFGTAGNWSPARTSPAIDDVLLFSGGGTVTATGVTTQTIGRLAVTNGTVVTLQASATATLTIAGTDGADLDVAAGSGLRLAGASALTVAIGAAATGSIAGTVDLLGGAHRIAALGANALELQAGAVLTCGTGHTTYPFGPGTGTSAPGSVVLHAGALLAQVAGLTPFGTSATPVVTFEHGSRYRVDAAAVTPALGGRTYADFEQNALGSVTPGGTGAFTVDSVVVTRGTLNVPIAGTIRGDITIKSGATLNLNPPSATTFTLGGAGTQAITPMGALNTTANAKLLVANPAGIVLGNSLTLGGALQFSSGRLTTGAFVLGVTGAITGASQSDGFVAGNLQLAFPAGDSTRVFDIGDATTYTPVTIAMHGVASPFNLLAATHTPDHPALATSGLDPAKSVNRYWTVTPAGLPTYSNFDATFSYRANNLDANAEPALFVVRRYAAGAWSATATGTRTSTSTQAVSITDFGDFAIADPPSYALTVAIAGAGSVTRSPNQTQFLPGSSVQLTAVPDAGGTFYGWSGDASGTTNPITIVMNSDKSVTAAFTNVGYTLTTSVSGGGAVTKNPDQPAYSPGTQVVVTAVPQPGWHFVSWSGGASGTTNPLTVTMDADKTVTATFAVNPEFVSIVRPNGFDSFQVGTVANFLYTTQDTVPVTSVDVWLSRTGAGGPYAALATGLANTGSYDWTVTGPVTSDAVLRVLIHDTVGGAYADSSDTTFRIVQTVAADAGEVRALELAVPNPLRASGTARLALPVPGRVRLRVLDLAGREVAAPLDAFVPAGRREVRLDAAALRLAPGLYFARLETAGGALTRRFVVAR